MSIIYNEKANAFKLDTENSSYVISVVDKEKYIGHAYYGKRISDVDIDYLLRIYEDAEVPSKKKGDSLKFMDTFKFEYPVFGQGDMRRTCLNIKDKTHMNSCGLGLVNFKIYEGKPLIPDMPATFGNKEDCMTLELLCRDRFLNIDVTLFYSVFEKEDVITRWESITNSSDSGVSIKSALSVCLDMDNREYDLITLSGRWATERHIIRRPIMQGYQGVSSMRGVSSHQANPFMAVVSKNADLDNGEAYGFNLVYSGNFIANAELGNYEDLRIVMGISPEEFSYELSAGETFYTPEAVLTYSGQGINKMTHNFHDMYRRHLIRGKYKDTKRPVLINNWEATYFDFDSDKLLAIAKTASENHIEMLVMDDGWFGKRNDDTTSLGDWFVNEEKLKGGLSELVRKVNGYGLKFGIWFEPEMVSVDSEFYRKHPDYIFRNPEREPVFSRNQLVLDFTRKEVRDAVYEMMKTVLESANIEYVKWDMNRGLANVASIALPAEKQGELYHRYVLGVYDLMNRLTTDFPNILLENCSSGGGRFDAGMLYYSPQIWCSDDTDAIERLSIQEGTAICYPLSTMGAHVADCPSCSTGRNIPFKTRGDVALCGTFGYELDITKIPKSDLEMIPKQIEKYHRYNHLYRTGDYYRIASYSENEQYDAYMVVAKDASEALATYVRCKAPISGFRSLNLRLKGLAKEKKYKVFIDDEEKYTLYGDTLMAAGIQVKDVYGDYVSTLIYLKEAD